MSIDKEMTRTEAATSMSLEPGDLTGGTKLGSYIRKAREAWETMRPDPR